MSLLALDLARVTGWAHSNDQSGVWKFKPLTRCTDLSCRLDDVRRYFGIDKIEAERCHVRSVKAGRSISSGGVVEAFCGIDKIDLNGEHSPKTIKKFFTSNANASKEEMIAKCNELLIYPADDNEADAIALLQRARTSSHDAGLG